MSRHEVGHVSRIGLIKFGPLARITIGAHQSQMQQALALIDTGAESSVIHHRLSARLGLRHVDRRVVSDVDVTRTCAVVRAYIVCGDLEIPSPRRFVAYPLNERLSGDRFTVIIGRDILANLALHYNGLTGKVGLHRPHVD